MSTSKKLDPVSTLTRVNLDRIDAFSIPLTKKAMELTDAWGEMFVMLPDELEAVATISRFAR